MKKTEPLTTDERAKLTALKESFGKALRGVERHSKTHSTLCADLRKCEQRHEKLDQEANGGSEEASMRLLALQDQRMRLELSLKRAEANSSDDLPALRESANDFQQLAGPIFLQDFRRQIENALEEALAPFYTRREQARQVARDNDAIRSMGIHFLPAIPEDLAGMVSLAKRYVEAIDRLLAGEDVWNLQPAS